MIKLSVTSKLDGIKSWSLQAIDTCPGAKAANGELVAACKGCYATGGNYRFPNVKAPREFNRQDWKRDEWVQDMVQALSDSRYFRWFDSGDLYSVALAEKILQVMELTPWCSHWLPTRSHKFEKFASVLARMQALPNCVVRYSSDSINGVIVDSENNSTILQYASDATPSMTVCRAYEHAGKCSGCRACWSKSVTTIAYVAHGRSMATQYKKINLQNIA